MHAICTVILVWVVAALAAVLVKNEVVLFSIYDFIYNINWSVDNHNTIFISKIHIIGQSISRSSIPVFMLVSDDKQGGTHFLTHINTCNNYVYMLIT